MREYNVESKLVNLTTRWLKGHAYKFTSPNRRNVPDRLVLRPIPPEHRELVARYVRFVECKATGKDATKGQAREHRRLRDLGFTVHVANHYDTVTEIVEAMK